MPVTIGLTHISNALHLFLYHIFSVDVRKNFVFCKKNVSKPVFCFETFLFFIFPGNSDCFLSAPLFPSFRLFHHTVRSTPDTVRPEV